MKRHPIAHAPGLYESIKAPGGSRGIALPIKAPGGSRGIALPIKAPGGSRGIILPIKAPGVSRGIILATWARSTGSGGWVVCRLQGNRCRCDPPILNYGGWDSVSGRRPVVERKQSFGGGRS